MRINFTQVSEDLLILTVFIVTDAVAFIDNQQRKLLLKGVKITRHRLYAAEHDFALTLFTFESGGENIRFQPQRAIFGVVLRDQLFHMRQHQYPSAGDARQFGDHQAFTCAGRQNNHGGRTVAAKVAERGVYGFLLVGAECKNHGLTTLNGSGNSMP